MKRLLLVSTAMFGFALAPVLAQETAPAQPATPPAATEAPATDAPATDAPTMDAPATDAPAMDAPATDAAAPVPVPEQEEDQVRAESLLGVDVTNGQDTIGEVTDLVVTEDGQVEAIVVGIGGFLGIGEKSVALAWDSVEMTRQDDGRTFVIGATREELEAMPEYRTLEDQAAEAAATATQQQMDQGTMPATTAPATTAPGTTAPGTEPAAPATGDQPATGNQ